MSSRIGRLLLTWITTLKFKIVAIAVVTGVASATISTWLVLNRTQIDTQRMLLQHVSEERERSAALLASKVDILQASLSAVAARIKPESLANPTELTRFVQGQAAMHALFDNVFVASSRGAMLSRVRHGEISTDLPDVGDREYFHRVMQSGLPAVSRPLVGRASKAPVVILAVPLKSADGKPAGIFAGVLQLRTHGLLADLSHDDTLDLSRELVINADGEILAHPNPLRLMGRAEDEPGLADAYRQWADDGRTIHAEGAARLGNGYLVSMAGIPAANWMVVRVMPDTVALQPLIAAQSTAWQVAAAVGATAALLAGLLAWLFSRRITVLRQRAEHLLEDSAVVDADWPHGNDEVGQLSRAFLQVVHERQQRQQETHALLQQLQAVLDNAEVGIGFTRDGRFELVSQHFTRIFGWDQSMV